MNKDTIRANIDEWLGDLWHNGWEEGWQAGALSSGNVNHEKEWCEGFIEAWNANAATKLTTKNEGDAWHFECARCGGLTRQGVEVGVDKVKFKYCPNCGAEVRDE